MLELIISFDFSKIDTQSIIIAATGYSIVFLSLVFLYFIFRYLPVIINMKIRSKLKKQGKETHENEDLHLEGDVNAAISMALYLYLNEIHDDEITVLTQKIEAKKYSPWSSKLYGVYNLRK